MQRKAKQHKAMESDTKQSKEMLEMLLSNAKPSKAMQSKTKQGIRNIKQCNAMLSETMLDEANPSALIQSN